MITVRVLNLVLYTLLKKGRVMVVNLSTDIKSRLKTLVLMLKRLKAWMTSQLRWENGQRLLEIIRYVRNGIEKQPTKRSARDKEIMK